MSLAGLIRRTLAPNTRVSLGALFLVCALICGGELVQDLHWQNEVRQTDSRKANLAVQGELELGRAVQDFKDCLLREDANYCEDFYRHLAAVESAAAAYGAEGRSTAGEREELAALHEALGTYRSSLREVLEMQHQHATIREIDAAVRGADRPLAAELSRLAVMHSGISRQWRVAPAPATLLIVSIGIGGWLLGPSLATLIGQHRKSRQSRRALCQLSNQMLQWEDSRKAQAFTRLHDEICQSLSAIMYFLKSRQHATAGAEGLMPGHIPEPVIPSLQSAIRDARAVAFQLRPRQMQDSGVLATLSSLWIDGQSLNQRAVIDARIALEERHIPDELKPVILHIAHMTMEFAGQQPAVCPIAWTFERAAHCLTLSIGLPAAEPEAAMGRPATEQTASRRHQSPTVGFAKAIRAAVVLSGGESESTCTSSGALSLLSTWPLDELLQG